MNDITIGHGRDWTLSYTKADGSPGLIDPNSVVEILTSPDGFAAVMAAAFDTVTGTMVVSVDHNGSVGDCAVTINADGDLGAGTTQISITETFSMVVSAGAVGVSGAVSPERVTP